MREPTNGSKRRWTPLEAPFSVGRYSVVGEIGRGGMAEVLVAVQGLGGVERLVAIKRILPELAKDRAFVDMMLDEARLVSRVQHPNVVQVYDYLAREGQPLIVMEYLPGVSLRDLIRSCREQGERLAAPMVAHLMRQAALGLHAAHELRDADHRPLDAVHRDVSPDNLLVTIGGAVKVIDFGIAKAEQRITRTQHGQLKGKLRYMSPEQLATKPVDRRSDVYSLGIVLAEALLGEAFFRQRDVAGAIEERDSERSLADVDEALRPVVARACARKPAERYPSARAFADALENYLREEGSLQHEERLAALVCRLAPELEQVEHEVREYCREAVEATQISLPEEGGTTFWASNARGDGAPAKTGVVQRRVALRAAVASLVLAFVGGAFVAWQALPTKSVEVTPLEPLPDHLSSGNAPGERVQSEADPAEPIGRDEGSADGAPLDDSGDDPVESPSDDPSEIDDSATKSSSTMARPNTRSERIDWGAFRFDE